VEAQAPLEVVVPQVLQESPEARDLPVSQAPMEHQAPVEPAGLMVPMERVAPLERTARTVHQERVGLMVPQAPAERLEPPVTVDHRAVAGLPEAQGLTVPAGRRALPARQERTARQGHQE
jgi:hypothetical protein